MSAAFHHIMWLHFTEVLDKFIIFYVKFLLYSDDLERHSRSCTSCRPFKMRFFLELYQKLLKLIHFWLSYIQHVCVFLT